MRSLNRKNVVFALAALILSGSGLLPAPSVSAVGPPVVQSQHAEESDQASELLKEIQSIPRDLERDAATLESYNFRGLSWRSHADQLTVAKQHINAVGTVSRAQWEVGNGGSCDSTRSRAGYLAAIRRGWL